MKSEVETLTATRVKLSVVVPFEELKPNMDAAYRSIAGQISVPGFRKGKVPPRIIDSRIGREAVIQEAVNEALPELYGKAAQESDIRPLAQPDVEITAMPDPKDGGDLTFTAEVDIRPSFELPDYSTLTVTIDPFEVTEEDVDRQLDSLRERFGTIVGVDRPAEDGDFVSIDLRASIDDEEIDSATGLSYQIGSGTMLPGMDEALIGLSAEEETSFEAPLAGGDHAGEVALVKLTLNGVKQRELPEADDEFAELASEFDTLDELRESLREQAAREKKVQSALGARDKVVEALIDACDMPVPMNLVEAEVAHHFDSEHGHSHGPDDDDEAHRAEVTDQVTRTLKAQLALDAVVEQEEVQIGQQELFEYLIAQAPLYGLSPQDFMQRMSENGQIPALMGEVARRKALALVLELAKVVDADGNEVDLDDLVPPAEVDGGLDEDEPSAGDHLEDEAGEAPADEASEVPGEESADAGDTKS